MWYAVEKIRGAVKWVNYPAVRAILTCYFTAFFEEKPKFGARPAKILDQHLFRLMVC